MVPAVSLHAADIRKFNTWLDKNRTASDNYDKQITRQYLISQKEVKRILGEFVRLVEDKWGKDNLWVPERKVWVQYSDDLKLRGSVDFENGIAKVQMLAETWQAADSDTVSEKLISAIEQLFLGSDEGPVEMMRRIIRKGGVVTKPKTRYYTVKPDDTLWGLSRRFKVSRRVIARLNNIGPDDWLIIGQRLVIPEREDNNRIAAQGKKVDTMWSTSKPDVPLLNNQLRFFDGTQVTCENITYFAREIIASQKLKRENVCGADGINRQVVSISFKLIPEHMKVRAKRYSQIVRRYSERFNITEALIYAIIHTESAFNQMAFSDAPAYGLMQLVPASGARDAYLMVYGEDKLLEPEYLYDPENNIELGTAYLHILERRYLKHIENPTSRMYCSIAAYNTGAGNVCRAFRDDTSVRQAILIINQMSPNQVYDRLRSDLPYEETRNYIKKVCGLIPLYENCEWVNSP